LYSRKIEINDLPLIRDKLDSLVYKLRKSNKKSVYKILSVDTAMEQLPLMDNVYIVDECYLVIYEIFTPWYSDRPVLAEQLVLQLRQGGDFSVIPAFLEKAASEQGACMAVVGTMLARSDAALAAMYQQGGFKADAITLSKET